MQDYVAANMGQRFIEPQTSDLGLVYKDSSPTTPLVFVLSQGTDPANDLYKFAETMRFSKKLTAISLGQGQVNHFLLYCLLCVEFTFKALSFKIYKVIDKIKKKMDN